MGCGCGRGGRRHGKRPAIGPGASAKGGLAAAKTPTERRAIERQAAKDNKGLIGNLPRQSVQKRLQVEKKRRAMILKKLGR